MKRRLAQTLCWLLACCTLSATVAQAQPTELAPVVQPSELAPVAQPSELAPAVPSQPSELAPPTVRPAVPTPADIALAELHRIQLREPELWKERERYCVGCGAAGIALGVPVAVSMLTVGSLFVAFADTNYDPEWDSSYDDSWVRRDRIIGTTLLLIGLAGAAAAIWGTRKIIRERRPRNEALHELRSIAERRTILEQILETYVMQPQPAP